MATERQIEKSRTAISKAIVDITSPTNKQIEFLKTLLTDAGERKKFIDDPKGFSERKNIFLDPTIVNIVSKSLQFDPIISSEAKKLGPSAVKSIKQLRASVIDVRNPFRLNAFPAAVAAAAAVVAAAVAVATLVVTLVRVSGISQISRPAEMTRLKLLKSMGRSTRL